MLNIKNMKSIFLVFCLIVLSLVSYNYFSLKNNFLYKNSIAINSNLKTIITNTLINKYSYLFKSPSYTESNPYYMNLLGKFHTEFLQVLSGLKNTHIILYRTINDDGKIMVSTKYNGNFDDSYLSITKENIVDLLQGKEVHNNFGAYSISIFPLYPSYERAYDINEPPFMFLKIINNYNELSNFFIYIYALLIVVIVLVISIFIFSIYYIYSKNTEIISKQHDTNIKLQEEKEMAEQENISKSKFLANVSHELRTPLNAIIGFSELLQNETMGPINNTYYKEYVNDIHNSGVHLLSLINDILDFSTAEANKLTVEHIKFDLDKVVSSCFRMVQPKAEQAKVKLEKIFPDEQIVLLTDPKRMKQVIINILSNSIKFTPENGFVKLLVKYNANKQYILIEIIDNGIGISAQDLYKVMSVFGQADSNHSRKFEGTGLGLPLSKKLVELMNGTFHIKSEPNLGTVVTLIFPYIKLTEEKEF